MATYRLDNLQISENPFYIYEISLDLYWKNGTCYLGSKFYKSNKLIQTKSIRKLYKGYIIEKSITLLAAPYTFLQNLPIYKLKKRKNETVH